jgi:hypothetical protein
MRLPEEMRLVNYLLTMFVFCGEIQRNVTCKSPKFRFSFQMTISVREYLLT